VAAWERTWLTGSWLTSKGLWGELAAWFKGEGKGGSGTWGGGKIAFLWGGTERQGERDGKWGVRDKKLRGLRMWGGERARKDQRNDARGRIARNLNKWSFALRCKGEHMGREKITEKRCRDLEYQNEKKGGKAPTGKNVRGTHKIRCKRDFFSETGEKGRNRVRGGKKKKKKIKTKKKKKYTCQSIATRGKKGKQKKDKVKLRSYLNNFINKREDALKTCGKLHSWKKKKKTQNSS